MNPIPTNIFGGVITHNCPCRSTWRWNGVWSILVHTTNLQRLYQSYKMKKNNLSHQHTYSNLKWHLEPKNWFSVSGPDFYIKFGFETFMKSVFKYEKEKEKKKKDRYIHTEIFWSIVDTHSSIKIIYIYEMDMRVENSNSFELLLELLIMVLRKFIQPFQTTILRVKLAVIRCLIQLNKYWNTPHGNVWWNHQSLNT